MLFVLILAAAYMASPYTSVLEIYKSISYMSVLFLYNFLQSLILLGSLVLLYFYRSLIIIIKKDICKEVRIWAGIS